MLTLVAALTIMQAIPRPEHPRPDMLRADWQNLNGRWDFFESDDEKATPTYPDKINVPFCRESKLSGLERKGFVKNVWYRRTFETPKWTGKRTILHIGACDYRTTVWVNGKRVGEHVGGNVSFGFDITDHLANEGGNTVVIHAFDDTASGKQPTGKQSQRPESHGIFYTRTTGIWQTVWLEGVGQSYIKNVAIEPDLANKEFRIRAEVEGSWAGMTLDATVKDDKSEANASVPAEWRNGFLTVKIPTPHLWSPKDPHLYDIELNLSQGHKKIDAVKTYAGMRSVSIQGNKILINGEPVFQRLVLDQGFWPDGVWTAPTDDELRLDIERSMACGLNGARMHEKVFEPRYMYWADKLGYLCWAEYPNYGGNYSDPQINIPYLEEWAEEVRRDRNHPSIIGWCPFNETDSSSFALQKAVVNVTRQLDPSRPIIETSGYTHGLPDPEVLDAHDYDQNPLTFRARWTPGDSPLPDRYSGTSFSSNIPFMISEYGGIGWATGEGWGYGNAPKSLEEFYERLGGLTSALTDNPFMFGFVYTQLTDVEQERNGLYTFDRKPKFDLAKLKSIFGRPTAYEGHVLPKPSLPPANFAVLVGSARDGETKWKVTEADPGTGWNDPKFDDAKWRTAIGGFGAKGGSEKDIRTPWTSSDIWLRHEFEYAGQVYTEAMLAIHFDNATEVYLNGTLIWKSEPKAWNDGYAPYEVTAAVKKALKQGRNTIAVHCHQDTGGQFIDLALLLKSRER